MNKQPLYFLDTNIFIYYFQKNEKYGLKAKRVFEKLVENKAKSITSVITQTELLSFKMSYQEADKLLALFLETPNLKIENIDQKVANKAAEIRRNYNFKTPDSLQLAVAVLYKADFFLTSDRNLKQFKEISVELL